MKLQILSDIHLDHIPISLQKDVLLKLRCDVDAILLAGDIFSYYGIEFQMQIMNDVFNGIPIYFIPGNHEYYNTSKNAMDIVMIEECLKYDIHYLENMCLLLPDNETYIIGGCGWHDSINDYYMSLNDFHKIHDLKIDKCSSMEWNKKTFNFFKTQLERLKDKKVICMSHNSPLNLFIPEKFKNDPLNTYFVNDWSDLINEYKPILWVSGHFHQHKTFIYESTYCVENSYGYYQNTIDMVNGFKENFIVEI